MDNVPSSVSTIEHAGFSISSNTASAEDLSKAFGVTTTAEPKPAEDTTPEATSTDDGKDPAAVALGKKGGQAAAAMRKAEAKLAEKQAKEESKIKPIKDAPKPAEAQEASQPDEAKVQGEEAKADEAKADDGKEKPLGKPRDDPRARMLEATRKEAEAKRELQREREERQKLEARLAELERRTSPPKEEKPEKAASPEAGDDPEPREEDFENYADFVKAGARWAARQEYRETAKKVAERRQSEAREQAINEAVQGFYKRIDEAFTADPGMVEKTAQVAQALRPSFLLPQGERPGPLNVIADEIISSERAPALMLHFAEHPEELDRISKMRRPTDIIVEMRVLARSVAAATAGTSRDPEPAPKPAVSKAGPVVRPVTHPPAVAEPGLRPGMSLDEYARVWEKTQLPKIRREMR